MNIKTLLSLSVITLVSSSAVSASVAGFDDLALAPDSYFSSDSSTSFSSGDASFAYNCSIFGGICYWDGFTYSNTTDTTTAGFGNQYSNITGSGANASTNFGIGFTASRVDFSAETRLDGAYFTNTTYAYLSMRDGDTFAKQFENGDFFTLTVTGLDAADAATSSLDISLATGTDLLASWLWVDLSSLGNVSALSFSLSSSDNGPFGMNTPAYFAIDELTFTSAVPLPAAVWLFGSGLLALFGANYRRK